MLTEHARRLADDWTATDGMALNQSALTGLRHRQNLTVSFVLCTVPAGLLNFHSRFPP